MRRLVLACLIAAAAAVGLGLTAEAHALLRTSVPADGQTLDRAPTQVSITFTERPEAGLSIIHVYNSGGQKLERGHAQALASDPSTLVVALPALPNGVYTVGWTTVSAVDGHVASGAFAFGVGTTPTAVSASGPKQPPTPPPAPLGVAGKWIYYVGLALLLGGTWIALFAFRAVFTRLLMLAGFGALAGSAGLLLEAESQRETAGVDWSSYLTSSLSGNLLRQLIPVVAAGAVLLVAARVKGRRQELALGAVGALALVAIVMHGMTTHADASHLSWLMLPAQWAHLTAFAVWIGGLSALLLGSRGLPIPAAAVAVRRFSFVAGLALATIAITGTLRALDEVGSVARLTATLFGGLVLVKVGLFLVLAMLGAINRYRNVPQAEWNSRGLRRVGRTEIVVAAGVVAVAAVLSSLAPPSYTPEAAAPRPQQIVASSHDPGTLYAAELIVAPGYPGSNRFTVRLKDLDSGRAVNANRVSMRFLFPGRPSIGESVLSLKAAGGGSYVAQGTNLSLAGRWNVTVVVEAGLNSGEVPLTVTTAVPAEHISVSRQPGLPDIYTVLLRSGRSAQLYVDSSQAGFYNIHATFFEGNDELAMADGAVISATPSSGPTVDMPVERFDPIGHFIGQGPLSPGSWRFDITASATDGATYQISFEETLK
ncbi:MAG TPA: copper resistance protein CopC [Candidatus Dormibacteraeota bacterium]